MAKRTPLGTSANFAVKPFNPTETEFHAYWGVYQWDTTGTPNVAGGRSGAIGTHKLPNEQGNPLAAPEWAKLRIGDTAGTAESQAVSDGTAPPAVGNDEGLFSCIYAGTAGGGDAVWVRLDNETGAIQTVRDAHVFVVAQQGYVTVPGSPPPYNLADGAGVLADYIDTGNGAQFAAALTAAAAASVHVDIRLRPCYIDLGLAGSPAVPLFVPKGCRLMGASRDESEVTSKVAAAASQEVFFMGNGSELLDLSVTSYAAVGAPGAGTSKAVVRTAASCRVRSCRLWLDGATRTQPWAIWDESATVQVLDCEFLGWDQDDANNAGPSIAITLGADPLVNPNDYVAGGLWRVDGCQAVDNGDNGYNHAVRAYNVGGGHVSECDFRVITRPQFGAIKFQYGGTVAQAAFNDVAPCVTDTRIEVFETEVPGNNPYIGIGLLNQADPLNLGGVEWTACRVLFTGAPQNPIIERIGYAIAAQATSPTTSSKVEGGTINGCITVGFYSTGILLLADGGLTTGTGRVGDIRITGNVHKAPSAIGGSGFGIHVKAQGGANGQAVANGISNCSCTSAPATVVGVNVEGANAINTIVVGNNLTPSGGTAFTDTGTGTEAGHNII